MAQPKRPQKEECQHTSTTWLRGAESNRRSSGYEPDGLPLPRPAISYSSSSDCGPLV